MAPIRVFLAGWFLVFSTPWVAADGQCAEFGSEDLSGVYEPESRLTSVATGYLRPTDIAPAVATVITGPEIRALGVRTLAEALETAPGVHVSTSRGLNSIVSIRGIFSELSPHVLVMVDNIPISQGFITSFSQLNELPVNNIDRVEIVRGPGSALYGAEAFSGVVNVITRTTAGFSGTEFGARAGYFNTFDGWLLKGTNLGPFRVAFSLSGSRTDGYERTVEADAQTEIDQLFGTRASLAPGPLNTGRDTFDMRLNVSYENLRLRLGYVGLLNAQNGAGVANALDPLGQSEFSHLTADVTYQKKFSPTLELQSLVSFLDTTADTFAAPFPPGTAGGLFPEGTRDELDIHGQQRRIEASLLWSGIKDHQIRGGLGYYDIDMMDIHQRTNSRSIVLPDGSRARIPTGRFDDPKVFGIENGLPTALRQVYFGFAQDEWSLHKHLIFTTGVRLDGYSDVGAVASPRGVVVWEAAPNTNVKLLFGRANRPASFAELYARANNSTAVGNPELVPEVVDTLELALISWNSELRAEVNTFGYWIHDPIVVTQAAGTPGILTFKNGAAQTGVGVEASLSWDPSKTLHLNMNYAFQESLDSTANSLGTGPRHQIFWEAIWNFTPFWSFDVNTKSVLGRERVVGDPRPPIDDYTLVNVSLRRRDIVDHVDIAFTARNVFNEDARDPSSGLNTLRFDYPLAGQNFWFELRIHWEGQHSR
jgi:outer membrane receptor for ferrienterochelin and colicins